MCVRRQPKMEIKQHAFTIIHTTISTASTTTTAIIIILSCMTKYGPTVAAQLIT